MKQPCRPSPDPPPRLVRLLGSVKLAYHSHHAAMFSRAPLAPAHRFLSFDGSDAASALSSPQDWFFWPRVSVPLEPCSREFLDT